MPARVRSSTSGYALIEDAVVVDRPSGTRSGDVLLAVHFNDFSTEGTGAPQGWQPLLSWFMDGFVAVRVWRKTAGSSEPSTYRFRQEDFAVGTVHLLCLADVDTQISPKVSVDLVLGEDAPTPSVQPAAGSHLEVRAASVFPYVGQELSWSPPPGYASRGSVNAAHLLSSSIATRQVNSSAPSGVKTFQFTPQEPRFGVGVSVSLASATSEPDTGPPPPAFTPGRGSALYRYVFTRWDGTYLDDLELSGVTFDRRIGQPGTFSASVPLPNSRIVQRVRRVIPSDPAELAAGPGVVTCVILRDGDPWGEYWITMASVSRSGRSAPSLQLSGSTVDAYMTQVEIQQELSFEGEDQIDIARALIEDMQGREHANLRLIAQAGSSGVARDVLYAANEGSYGQRLQELAQADNGFEWVVNIAAGTSQIERHWVWGAPRLGDGTVKHVFSDSPYGGDILDWSEEIDALRGGTYWRARGDAVSEDASTSAEPLVSEPVLAEAHLAAGWPRLDRTVTFPRESVEGTLDDYAAYWAANAPGALRVDQITVALGKQPTFTPNSLGDTARIFLHNDWHGQQSRTRRIIGISITPPSREGGKEIAQLTFEGIEAPTGG
ncbi:hypothetical protein ACQEUU_37610 [Nonomuraea sp. CA-218870]|uniref:hypothetical protein n=1 Tax=Nonomuraea sp. CA-218870 TaxID=3239998 RepID=UPI003D924746